MAETRMHLEQRSLLDRGGQSALVEIIELPADRHAVREPGHLNLGVLRQLGYVVRRGVAVDRGVERQNYFLRRLSMGACDQRVDREVLRADAVKRRQRAA